jgi:protein SCO1
MIFSPARGRASSRVATCLVITALAVASAACGGRADSTPIKVDGPTPDLHGTRLVRPFREPDLTLTGTAGRPVNLKQATRGKLTLVYFGYTHCPDVCPTTMADLAGALRRLPPAQRSRIAVVFVTTDPWRDTPKVIKSWLAAFDASFIGMTGDYAKIRAAARSLGIPLEKPTATAGDYEVTHGAEVLPFGADHLARVIYTSGVTSKDWVVDLPKLLRESGGA